MIEHVAEAGIGFRVRRDRPRAPSGLHRPEEFEIEERREAIRDGRWRRRKEQLVVAGKLAGGGTVLALAAALWRALPL